jgi:hypothetical protein
MYKTRLVVLAAAGMLLAIRMAGAWSADSPLPPRLSYQDGTWVYLVNISGKEDSELPRLTPATYDWATEFGHSRDDREDSAVVANHGRYGVIDRSGKVLVPLEYDFAWPFDNGMAVVYRGGKFGAVDRSGRLAVPLEYDLLYGFGKAGTASAVKDGKWGVVDRTNHVRLPFQWLLATAADSGSMRGFKAGWNIFDASGKRFPSDAYSNVVEYPDVLIVSKDGGKQLVDWTGKPILQGSFEEASYDSRHGIAVLSRDGNYGAYDVRRRRWILQPSYADIYVEYNGLLMVTTAATPSKAFFADRNGRKLAGAEFDAESIGFADGSPYAKVRRSGLWGLIDAKGRQILPFVADSDEHIHVNEHWISALGKTGWGVVDRRGKPLVAFEYYGPAGQTDPFPDGALDRFGTARHAPSGRVGIIDHQLRWKVPLGRYGEIGVIHASNDLVEVGRDGLWGIYDVRRQREVVPLQYELVAVDNDFSSLMPRRSDDRWSIVVHTDWRIHKPEGYKLDRYDDDARRLVAYRGEKTFPCRGFEAGAQVGLLDEDDHEVVPMQYQNLQKVGGHTPAWYYAEKDGRAGFIDVDGKVAMPFDFDAQPNTCAVSDMFYHGYIRLWQHDQYVLADASGNILARQDQFRFGPGLPSGAPSLWYQHVGNMWVAVAETGEGNDKQIRFLWKGRLYDMPGGSDVARNGGPRLRFSDGLMAVRRDGKFGYLDVDGNEALPFAYEAARTFSSGKAYVRQDGKWRIINRDGTRLRHFDVMYAFLVKGDTRD